MLSRQVIFLASDELGLLAKSSQFRNESQAAACYARCERFGTLAGREQPMHARRALLIGSGTAAVLVVGVIAGWWFFVRETAELATEPAEIPRELVGATEPPADGAAADGSGPSDSLIFQIIPEESEAAYFVDEQLASLPVPSTVTGTTNAIAGQLVFTADGAALAAGNESTFTVDLTTLTSDESRRDNRVQDALETSAFPVATFMISGATGFDPSLPEGEQQNILLTGALDLHGVQHEVTWEVEIIREANVISALATVTIDFADFDVTPPNIAGIVSVGDELTLQVQLIARAV